MIGNTRKRQRKSHIYEHTWFRGLQAMDTMCRLIRTHSIYLFLGLIAGVCIGCRIYIAFVVDIVDSDDPQEAFRNRFKLAVFGDGHANPPNYTVLDHNYFSQEKCNEFRKILFRNVNTSEVMWVDGSSVIAPLSWDKYRMKNSECDMNTAHSTPRTQRTTHLTRLPVCAVVGNSGIVKGKRCGVEINDADYIFRANLAPVMNYRLDVGSKTNFTSMNPSVFAIYYNSLKDAQGVESLADRLQEAGIAWVNNVIDRLTFLELQNILFSDRRFHQKYPTLVYVTPFNLTKNIAEYWKPFYDMGEHWPTSGMIILTYALAICDEVRLYGFYPYSIDSSGNSVDFHYYPEPMEYNNNRHHDFDREHKFLLYLHKKGILTMRQRCFEMPIKRIRKRPRAVYSQPINATDRSTSYLIESLQ